MMEYLWCQTQYKRQLLYVDTDNWNIGYGKDSEMRQVVWNQSDIYADWILNSTVSNNS